MVDTHMVASTQIFSIFIIFALSLLVIRIGSVALRMTGLSPDVSSFQAASAFSGAGFTTEEAEFAVSEPSRRTTVLWLIRIGSIGVVGTLASLLLSFINSGGENSLTLVYVLGGVLLIIAAAKSQLLNEAVTPLIERALERTTDLEIKDYTQMLGLQSEYRVAEVDVSQDDWISNNSADEMNLAEEGVLLLGIRRNGDYIGAPRSDTEIHPDDTVVLYGKKSRLQELSNRAEGNVDAHEDAIEEHKDVLDEQAELIDQ
ncbi:TrkA C-terminal domain-containing protein [Halalkalicoccus subterraneus]|uniref:TrkA C-terminal domain-containing protein n=1 Tax=Halalkalicoccus subterraneus TaxID=2675002 RepID=UPI001FE969D7|nr:TrkA C-terminal domain-containing protein [Halalkalicoccus subterraneus]